MFQSNFNANEINNLCFLEYFSLQSKSKMVYPGYKTDKSYYLQAPTLDLNKKFSIDDEETEDELLFQQSKPIIIETGACALPKTKDTLHSKESLIILFVTFCVVAGLYVMRKSLF